MSKQAQNKNEIKNELRQLNSSIKKLCKHFGPEPEKKPLEKFIEWALPKSGLLSVSALVLTMFITTKGCIDAQSTNTERSRSALTGRIEELIRQRRDARDQLNVVLGDSSKEQSLILIFRSISGLIGHKENLDDAYFMFSFRMVGDLQVERAIVLLQQLRRYDVELSAANEKRDAFDEKHGLNAEANNQVTSKPSETDINAREIKDLFLLSVLLAQSGDFVGGEHYSDRCLEKIQKNMAILNDEIEKLEKDLNGKAIYDPTYKIDQDRIGEFKSQLEIHASNWVHAKTLSSLITLVSQQKGYYPHPRFAIDYADKKSREQFSPTSSLREIYRFLDEQTKSGGANFGMHPLRIKLAKGAVHALEAMTSFTIADAWLKRIQDSQGNDKKIATEILESCLREAEFANEQLCLLCENDLRYLPDSELTNVIGILKTFVFLSASQVQVRRAELYWKLRQENFKLAKDKQAVQMMVDSIEKFRRFVGEFEANADLVRRADLIHATIVLGLEKDPASRAELSTSLRRSGETFGQFFRKLRGRTGNWLRSCEPNEPIETTLEILFKDMTVSAYRKAKSGSNERTSLRQDLMHLDRYQHPNIDRTLDQIDQNLDKENWLCKLLRVIGPKSSN